jgi:hypothetical protein
MTEVKVQDEKMLTTQNEAPMGFEDEQDGDLIVPRVKVVQSLSPERKEKTADEGDIINSLTKEKLQGKTFIPVFKFNNNIWWKPRSEGGGIQCISREGKVGKMSDGTSLMCAICRKNEFDNTKQGAAALPSCTKYINFFGFFSGEPMPIILSFAKTNFNEGKKLYSLAKVTMQNMWNHGYTLNPKEMSKGGNDWFIIDPQMAGPTSDQDKMFGRMLYDQFRSRADLNFDMEDTTVTDNDSAGPSNATKEEVDNAEF